MYYPTLVCMRVAAGSVSVMPQTPTGLWGAQIFFLERQIAGNFSPGRQTFADFCEIPPYIWATTATKKSLAGRACMA